MEELHSIVNRNDCIKIKQPGFVVKTICKKDKIKFFINVCHSDSISPPTLRLDEKDLQELIVNEKYEELSKFTVPLVIELLESTKDKKNELAKLTHVIVNSKFYAEIIAPSVIYKNYLVYIVIDTINAKFNLKLDNTTFVILKNKKFQLPSNNDKFQKFINAYIPPNILTKTESSMRDNIIKFDNDQENNYKSMKSFDKLISECKIDVCSQLDQNEEQDQEYKNLIISLDISKEIIYIKLKLDNEELRDVKLKMNDDHVIILHDGIDKKIIKEFYLPIRMNYEMAMATINKNILSIQSPVLL